MQIKRTSGQLKMMTSDPEYIAERSVWLEESLKAVIRRQNRLSIAESNRG